MKRRIALLATAVAVLVGILGVGPARADFHGLCTPASGPTAYANLKLTGSTLTYTGEVKCVGRAVTINSLVLTIVDANGLTRTTGVPSCAACANPIATGQYAAPGPGEYSLYMDFSIQGGPQRFRSERAVWNGPGNPLKVICGGTDAANQQNFCPVPEGMTQVPAAAAMLPDLGADD